MKTCRQNQQQPNGSFKERIRRIYDRITHLWRKRKVIVQELKHRQRFIVLDTDTNKEKWSFQLSMTNLLITFGLTAIVMIVLTIVLVAFTPLREFIPGYASQKMTYQTYQNALALDSLEMALNQQEQMMADIKDLMMGHDPNARRMAKDSSGQNNRSAKASVDASYTHSSADSALRKEVESWGNDKSHYTQTEATAISNAPSVLLYAPIKGSVAFPYDANRRHFGVEIAGTSDAVVKSVAPGTILTANFTIESGYVITIQHAGGMTSLYKNMGSLLKSEGHVVRAGEPIGHLAKQGVHSSNPQLYFELWMNGKPVNPSDFISF